MTAKDKTTLKSYFETDDTPTEAQFVDFIDTVGMLTLVVAANDASDSSKGRADYVCDGTADDVEIAAALAALPGLGGAVVLSEGTFNLTATITLPAKSVRLTGQGVPTTDYTAQTSILNFTLASGGNCIVPSNDGKPQLIEGIGIYGDGTNTQRGIYLQGNTAFKSIRDVAILNVVTAGVRCDSGNSQCEFSNIQTRDLDCHGFDTYGQANFWYHCRATRSAVKGITSSYHGFVIHEIGTSIIGCFVERYEMGYQVGTSAAGVALMGCASENCNHGFQVSGGAGTEAKSISILGGAASTNQDDTYAGVLVGRAYGTTIVGLNVGSAVSNTGYRIDNNAYDTTIVGGLITPSTPFDTSISGTRTRVMGIYGFISQNSGTDNIASGTTSKTITHGLGGTPTVDNIRITLAENPDNTPGAIWVDTITSTQFNVNCENDPGASNLDFGWKASVY